MRIRDHLRIALLALSATLALAAAAAAQTSSALSDRVVDQAGILDASTRAAVEEAEPALASAQTFPALTGRVVDAAGVLDPANRKALVARLEALEAATSDQLVVATVASLRGEPIESYANRLFNIWKLGRKDRNNGVLLLVAPSERKVRIEVGYGLEGTLTDAVAKLIIERSIVPRFRNGDFAGGIAHAVDDIVSVLSGDAGTWQRRAAAPRALPSDNRTVTNLPPVLGILLLVVTYGGGALLAALAAYIVIFGIVRFLIAIHLLPQRKKRAGFWLWLNVFDNDMYDRRGRRASYASGSSDSSSSFSGGGGSSGGGGASGSW
jgi:uncharacterized protein